MSMRGDDTVQVFESPQGAAAATAACLFDALTEVVERNGVCHIALPGGNTPVHCFRLLSEMVLPWERLHWYPGDERCVPVGDDNRNDKMIVEALFARQPAFRQQFHAMPAELGAEQAADVYMQQVKDVRLDIALLGMGEDGHVASLFPGNAALQDKRLVVPVFDAPKLPAERVSFGMTALQQANYRMVLTAGQGKQDVIKQIRQGEVCPVTEFRPSHWFIDRQANGQL